MIFNDHHLRVALWTCGLDQLGVVARPGEARAAVGVAGQDLAHYQLLLVVRVAQGSLRELGEVVPPPVGLTDSFGDVEVVLEDGVDGLALGAVVGVDGLGWNSFLLELRLLSLEVLLHPGVLDDVHGGEAVVPLPSGQLPEEVGLKQPEFDLKRIVRQGPGSSRGRTHMASLTNQSVAFANPVL